MKKDRSGKQPTVAIPTKRAKVVRKTAARRSRIAGLHLAKVVGGAPKLAAWTPAAHIPAASEAGRALKIGAQVVPRRNLRPQISVPPLRSSPAPTQVSMATATGTIEQPKR
jgi:hypothetical protein